MLVELYSSISEPLISHNLSESTIVPPRCYTNVCTRKCANETTGALTCNLHATLLVPQKSRNLSFSGLDFHPPFPVSTLCQLCSKFWRGRRCKFFCEYFSIVQGLLTALKASQGVPGVCGVCHGTLGTLWEQVIFWGAHLGHYFGTIMVACSLQRRVR